MFDPKENVRGVVLAGAIESAAIEPTPLAQRRGPAIRHTVASHAVPLDLDAPIFRYLIRLDGSISPMHDAVGARACCAAHRRG